MRILRAGFFIFLLVLLIGGGYRLWEWVSPSAPSVYSIGMDTVWYPLNLYGKEASVTAFSQELLFAIARDQKIKVEVIRTGPKRLKDLLDDWEVDGILTSVIPDVKTEAQYYFSEPYYKFGAVFILKKSMDYKAFGELPHKRIAVKRGSSIMYQLKIDQNTTLSSYDSLLMAFEDLVQGKFDAIVVDQLPIFLYFGSLYRDKLRIATPPLTSEGLRLMTIQESYTEELIEKFNAGLQNLKDSGAYNRLIERWELFNAEKLPE